MIQLFCYLENGAKSRNLSPPVPLGVTPCGLGKRWTAREPPPAVSKAQGSSDTGRQNQAGFTGDRQKRAFTHGRERAAPRLARAAGRDKGLRPEGRLRPRLRSRSTHQPRSPFISRWTGRPRPAGPGGALGPARERRRAGPGRAGQGRASAPAVTSGPLQPRRHAPRASGSDWRRRGGAGLERDQSTAAGGGCPGGMVHPSRLPSPLAETEPFGRAVTSARARPGRTPRAARRVA